MRRFLPAGLLILSLVGLFLLAVRSEDTVRYSQLHLSAAEIQQIQAVRKETGRDLLDRLTFNNYPLFFDESDSRWFYSINKNAPITDPTVGWTGAGEKVSIAFSGEIQPGKDTSFIAYTNSEYKTYTLVTTTLPLLEIDNPDLAYLTGIDIAATYPMHFTLFDNRPDSLYPYVQSEGTIHIRGEMSRFFVKKNFRIQLIRQGTGKDIQENPIPLLGLRNDGDWVLNSAYNDQEKVRNVFTTNLWMESCAEDNSFGLKNGTEYRFVELFWNHEYCGLYALAHPIDPEVVNVRPDATGHYEEFLYKQKHWGPKTEGPDPNYDGLILQMDASQSDLNNGIALTKAYFAMLEAGASGGLWHNDEENAYDIWLFIKLIQGSGQVNHNHPGKIRNMYLTLKKSDTGMKMLYTPWDLDISWGNVTNTYNPSILNSTSPYLLKVDDNSYEMEVNPVSILRESDPNVLSKLKQKYAELRAAGWSDDIIDSMIDGFEEDIYGSGAYLRDMERWPEGSYQDPELGLSVFRKYVHDRLQAMDQYISSLSLAEDN